jgi:hypothetical protein
LDGPLDCGDISLKGLSLSGFEQTAFRTGKVRNVSSVGSHFFNSTTSCKTEAAALYQLCTHASNRPDEVVDGVITLRRAWIQNLELGSWMYPPSVPPDAAPIYPIEKPR